MCVAAALPMVAMALSAYSAYSGAQNQKAALGYQAKVAENNATLASYQATDALERGDRAAADVRRKYSGLMGAQRASLAARGLDITDGSANASLQDTAYFGELDENTTRANAAREAWGYKVRGANFSGDAAASRAQGDAINPLLAGAIGGAQTYLSGAGRVAPRWYQGSETNWNSGTGGSGSSGPWGGRAADPWYG